MTKKSTVLIVDDQEAMRDALKSILKKEGYELAFATNGQEALNLAAQLRPDLILLDVMMPGIDGFEVCQRLRADPVLANVPIIMVTALNDQDSLLRGIESGADDFISKPYKKLELRARVRNITKLNRYQRLLNEQTKLKWMFDNTDEAYLVLNHDMQMTYANAKARLYLNRPTNATINDNFMDIVAEQYNYVQEPSATPEPIDAKLTKLPRYIVRPDTETALPLWLRVDVMEISGESQSLVHLRNVTDTILAERYEWTLNGQLNHKLMTPLVPLMSGLDFMMRKHADITTEELKKFLNMAYEGAERLHTQIDQILNYTKESNMGQATQEPCTVTNLMSTITIVGDKLDIESLQIVQQDKIDNLDNFFIPISCTG